MMILEGSWVGDRTSDVFEVCGYQQICDDYDVEFHDTQKDKSFTKELQWSGTQDLQQRKGCRFSDQCTGHEGTLPDQDYLRPQEYEGIDPEHRKTSFSFYGPA